MVFLRSSERDPVFNDVAGRSTRFIPFPGWTLFFSTVLSRLFPRTDRLRNWVLKAERDMIVYHMAERDMIVYHITLPSASPDVWCTMHATKQTRWSMRALTTSRLISSASPTR